MLKRKLYRLVLILLFIGFFTSCEILTDADGVYPVEVHLSMINTQQNLQEDLPQLENVQLSISAISLKSSISETYHMSPDNPSYSLTTADSSKLLFSDYIPKDRFRTFDVSVGNFIADSSEQGQSHFLTGNFEGSPFTLALPDTLELTFEFKPPLDSKKEKDASAVIVLQVDHSTWFIDEEENVLDPGDTTSTAIIYENIKKSISVYYEIVKDDCIEKANGTCKNVGNGKDQSGLIEISGDSKNENEGSLSFNVNLSEPMEDTVRVEFESSDNSAKESEDYESVKGSLFFNPGEINKTITVTIIDDTLKEPDERFTIKLTNVTGANLNRGKSRAQGIIVDDDSDNGNGNGNGGGNGNGNGGGNGNGNGNGNGGGNDDGNGNGGGSDNGNGNGGGNDDGNGNGGGSDNGNGNGGGSDNGNGNGGGNDNGNGNGGGSGNGNGNN